MILIRSTKLDVTFLSELVRMCLNSVFEPQVSGSVCASLLVRVIWMLSNVVFQPLGFWSVCANMLVS